MGRMKLKRKVETRPEVKRRQRGKKVYGVAAECRVT